MGSFPPQGTGVAAVPLEGEYTTWTHVWTRDYGAGVSIFNVLVDNSGTVYSENRTSDAYVKTYAGAETNIANYMFYMYEVPFSDPMSATGKYVLGTTINSSVFEVWEDGVQIFSRDVSLDDALAVELYAFCVSPNSEFIAIVSYNAAFDLQIVMLYEGS